MRIKFDNLQLCNDCMIAAINDDYSGIPDNQHEPIKNGLAELGPNLVTNFDTETNDGYDEFSSVQCDCCLTRLAGARYRFAVLE